jgi:hypothetical protein
VPRSALSFRRIALVVAPLIAAVLLVARVPLGFSVATVAAQVLQPFGSGLLVLAAAMVALAYVLSKIDWRPWRPREAPA